MAGWNGSGTFTVTYNWNDDKANAIPITASRMEQVTGTDIVGGINNCIAKDGQNEATADLPMGGFNHTGVGNASSRDEYLTMGQFQDNSGSYVTSGGSSNAYTISLAPAITSYTAGQEINFLTNFANTGATTVNVNGLGAKNLKPYGRACVGGEFDNAQPVKAIYDGTDFIVFSPLNEAYNSLQTLLNIEIFS